jgi:hypothetical protein
MMKDECIITVFFGLIPVRSENLARRGRLTVSRTIVFSWGILERNGMRKGKGRYRDG